MSREIRVVIADDHPPTRAGIARALDGKGFVICAEAADASTAVAEALHHSPDVCLLDIHMPGSGVEAAAAISSKLPETSVIMLTVSRNDEDLFDALRAGASGYLLKDMNPDRLPDAIRGVLNGEAAMPRSLVAHLIEVHGGAFPTWMAPVQLALDLGEQHVDARLVTIASPSDARAAENARECRRGKGAGACGAGRVEDDVVAPGGGEDRAGRGHRRLEGAQVGVQLNREGRVADEPVLVVHDRNRVDVVLRDELRDLFLRRVGGTKTWKLRKLLPGSRATLSVRLRPGNAGANNIAAFRRFFHGMLERGVYLPPSQFEAAFVSTAHDAEVVAATGNAFARAFAKVR